MIQEEIAELAAKPGSEGELLDALGRLAIEDEENRLCWAAQCVWLVPFVKDLAPAEARRHREVLFLSAGEHPELLRRIACELMWNALPGGAEGFDAEAGANASDAMRRAAAAAGIETQEEFSIWMNTRLHDDREECAEAIRAAIVEIVGTRWVFERSRF